MRSHWPALHHGVWKARVARTSEFSQTRWPGCHPSRVLCERLGIRLLSCAHEFVSNHPICPRSGVVGQFGRAILDHVRIADHPEADFLTVCWAAATPFVQPVINSEVRSRESASVGRFSCSFRPESMHRIDARCPPSRDETRRSGRKQQRYNHRDEHGRIERTRSVKYRTNQSRDGNTSRHS